MILRSSIMAIDATVTPRVVVVLQPNVCVPIQCSGSARGCLTSTSTAAITLCACTASCSCGDDDRDGNHLCLCRHCQHWNYGIVLLQQMQKSRLSQTDTCCSVEVRDLGEPKNTTRTRRVLRAARRSADCSCAPARRRRAKLAQASRSHRQHSYGS